MSKLDEIYKIVSAKFPEATIRNAEYDGDEEFIDWGERLNVYDDGSAFKVTYYPATWTEPEDASVDPIGVIGDSAKSVEAIASAFIALIEKEIADQKDEFESENAYADELAKEKKLLEENADLWADLEWERKWAGHEDDFYSAAQDAYDRGW